MHWVGPGHLVDTSAPLSGYGWGGGSCCSLPSSHSGRILRTNRWEDTMDLLSWVIVGAIIVVAVVGFLLWRKFGPGLPLDKLDRDSAEEVRRANEAAQLSRYRDVP